MHKIDPGMVEIQNIVFVCRMKDAEDIRRRSHPGGEFELYYFIAGNGRFGSGEAVHSVRPGFLFLCSPQTPHAIEVLEAENSISYYAVCFTLPNTPGNAVLRELLYRMASRPPRNIGRNHRFFFEELKERCSAPSFTRRMAAAHQFISFLYLIGDGDLPKGEPGNIHLEKALEMMQERVNDKLRLPDVTANLGITPSYMIRLFRRKLNITPMKYYTRLKVEAAAALLAETQLTVYEIADRLSFYSEYHFSRVFKNYTGTAPTVYRSKQCYRRVHQGETTHDHHHD